MDLAFPGKSTTQILQGLQSAFPFPQDDTQRAAHHLFGAFNLGICERAIEALRVGDAAQLGLLMVEAQREFQSKAQPLCPAQLTMNLANKVLNHPPLQLLVFGGKGVGSQGDGTVQVRECARSVVLPNSSPFLTSSPTPLLLRLASPIAVPVQIGGRSRFGRLSHFKGLPFYDVPPLDPRTHGED